MTEKRIGLISMILAGLGLLDSIYLTWVKIANVNALCGPIGDCESVNSSKYAEIAGVPIALLGAAAYLVLLLLLVVERRGGVWAEYGPTVVFGISLTGVLYSAYLTYIEIAVLKAICPYCVVSAIILGLLLVLSVVRLTRFHNE